MKLKKLYTNHINNLLDDMEYSLLKKSIGLSKEQAILAANMANENSLIDKEVYDYIITNWIIDEDLMLRLMLIELESL